MLVLKCPKEGCKGHLVGWNYKSIPIVMPNDDHNPEPIKITPEIRKQLEAELGSEPFGTFMDVVREYTEGKSR